MSMTREEEILSYFEDINPEEIASHIEQGTLEQWTKSWKAATGKSVIAALRPVSREQVEKVWRGEWEVDEFGHKCSKCGEYLPSGDDDIFPQFCPNCGDAKTDEAVEMVMERMEKLHEDNGCS